MKLGLGTVQFGLPYGVTNRRGQPPATEARRALETATECGIDLLDTAPAYGAAEAVVGEALRAGLKFRIVTKTAIGAASPAALRETFHRSLERMGVDRVHGLLLHRCADALAPGGEALIEAMQALQRAGLVERIGVSVYGADELDAVMKLLTPQIVQLPLSIVDQRLARSGHLTKLAAMGVEIHARSVFLQGLLVEPDPDFPREVAPYRATFAALVDDLRNAGCTPLEGALAYCARQPEVHAAIVGVAGRDELLQIVSASKRSLDFDFSRYALDNPVALNPGRWSPKVVAVLQARTSSRRLPGKVLRPLLGKPMLERQIERVKRANSLSRLVVATSDRSEDDAIAALCGRLGVDCFRGSLDDVLDRFHNAAAPYRPDHVVRLTGDCPLCDPKIIDQVVGRHLEGGFDYTSNALEPTFPDGLDVEVMRFACLEAAWRESILPSHREHVTAFIHTQPERFRLDAVRNDRDLSDLRWTVDEPEDFDLVEQIYAALSPAKPAFGTADILTLLETRPELRTLNRRTRNEGSLVSMELDREYLARIGKHP
jgi:spore coat polysaccharide biosynthesis protein SpsF